MRPTTRLRCVHVDLWVSALQGHPADYALSGKFWTNVLPICFSGPQQGKTLTLTEKLGAVYPFAWEKKCTELNKINQSQYILNKIKFRNSQTRRPLQEVFQLLPQKSCLPSHSRKLFY